MGSSARLLWLGLVVSCFLGLVLAEHYAWTEADDELPSWASDNTLQLQLSADSTEYAVIPLTERLAMGNSNNKRTGYVDISGNLKAVHRSNYNDFSDDDDVAYMSCDEADEEGSVDPKTILNELIAQDPRAIILFSTSSNWCSLDYSGSRIPYYSILSMVDPGEATTVLNHLNDTDKGEIVDVQIYGNTTSLSPSESSDGNGHSAVAMSILYSITGIITLLFVFIIVTGAVRAHRNPDRYGPRSGTNGRRGQSRAKGLARAVLETLPVVKFGDRNQPKPDPELEMDTATTDGQYPAAQRSVSTNAADAASHQTSRVSMAHSEVTSVAESVADENLGCSICTEDFKVGEDVRVLPCNHQYHPQCVDPWLIDVSGTCPLCRLDLRPGHGQGNSVSSVSDADLPPPLSAELQDQDVPERPTGNRFSRLLDVNRLRQASVEEQMEALRRLREDRMSREAPDRGTATSESDDRHQSAGFAEKLKERFRILTKSQLDSRRSSRC